MLRLLGKKFFTSAKPAVFKDSVLEKAGLKNKNIFRNLR